MSTGTCERFRGMIAMEVVGGLPEHERLALAAHTEGCATCRDDRAQLEGLPTALRAADPERLEGLPEPGGEPLPAAMRSAVLERLAIEGRRPRRVRRRHQVVAASAVGVVAAAVLALTLLWPGASPTQSATVALRGRPGLHAVVQLSAEPWGTTMLLHEWGQPAGELLSVSTESTSGRWWQTGTYRTTRASARVTMACALSLDEIIRVWVRDSHGAVVLSGTVGGTAGGSPGGYGTVTS